MCALRPVEIHPEAAAGAGLLLVLVALTPLPVFSARRALGLAALLGAYLAPLLFLNLTLGCEAHAGLLVLARWALLAVLAAALACAARGGERAMLAGLAVLAGSAASLVALWQGAFGLARQAASLDLDAGPLRDAILARLRSGRVYGTFLLPASLGGALSISLPLTIALAALARRRALRFALAGAAAAQGLALTWSFSLGAWVALAAAIALVLGPGLAVSRRGRGALAALFVGAIVLVAAGYAARQAWLPAPGPVDRPVQYRAGNYAAAAAMIRDHPLLGTGLGTFGNVFPAYRAEGMNESRYAHSTYLQLVAELGLGALSLLALVPVAAWWLRRRGLEGGPIGAAAAIGALAFLVQNAVDFTAYQPSVGALFVLACALAAAGDGGNDCPDGPAGQGGDGGPAGPGGSGRPGGPCDDPHARARGKAPARAARAGRVAIAAAAGVVLAASGLSDLARERAMAAHGVDADRELQSLRLAAALDPIDPQARGDLALVMAAGAGSDGAGLARLEEARREARRAVDLDPRTPFRRRELGLIDLRLGRPAGAWIGAMEAASLYPMNADYKRERDAIESRLFAGTQGGANR